MTCISMFVSFWWVVCVTIVYMGCPSNYANAAAGLYEDTVSTSAGLIQKWWQKLSWLTIVPGLWNGILAL